MQAIQEKSLKISDAFIARAAPPENLNRQTAATAEILPRIEISEDRYVARFARNAEEIDRALRLRFEVFNLELGEGLDSSFVTGRDDDEFDANCHHLIVVEKSSGEIVGTYRLQTLLEAKTAAGFYCAGEFDLENLPAQILNESLEIGRACIARAHRNTRVLFLLWKGLAAFAELKNKRYLFGCCSLTSQTAAEGWRAAQILKRENHFHSNLSVQPRREYVCGDESFGIADEKEFELPRLFSTYLRFGAKVCSRIPAIDRRFKTIDFFVIFDIETIDEKYRRMFFA